MATYLVENCDVDKFPAVFRAIEKAPDGITKMHLLVYRLAKNRRGIYAGYHLERPDQGKYMDIRFHANSLSIETNCSGFSMSKLLDTLPTFTNGNLKTIDDAVATVQSTR